MFTPLLPFGRHTFIICLPRCVLSQQFSLLYNFTYVEFMSQAHEQKPIRSSNSQNWIQRARWARLVHRSKFGLQLCVYVHYAYYNTKRIVKGALDTPRCDQWLVGARPRSRFSMKHKRRRLVTPFLVTEMVVWTPHTPYRRAKYQLWTGGYVLLNTTR